jgi:hypothetical protein
MSYVTLPRKYLSLLALAVSLLVFAPQQAHAARHMELALQDDAVLLQKLYYNQDLALRQIHALGVRHIRANLLWTRVLPGWESNRRFQPQSLHYNWSQYDQLIDAAARYGMRVQLTIAGPAPAWATGNHVVGVYKPNAGKFGAFTRSAAAHFRGRVSRYSIWNEPNYVGWLKPLRSGPKIYRGLMASGYRGIKSVDPGAQVLFGETVPFAIKGRATSPLWFLRGATCVNRHWKRGCRKGLRADGYAHHPYDFTHSPRHRYPGRNNVTIGTLGRLNKALKRLARSGSLRTSRGRRLNIYLTEFGYFSRGKRRLPSSRRAKYLRQAYRIARRTPHVKQLLQYLLVSPPRALGNFDTALIGRNGRATRVYHAVRKAGR